MSRDLDLEQFQAHRAELAARHAGQWLVFHDGALKMVFPTEQAAMEHALTEFGIDQASVFHACERDPFVYIGSLRGSAGTGA